MTDRWYTTDGDNDRTPVTLDDEARAVEPTGPRYTTPNGKSYRREIRREGQVVPAEPGWYALIAFAEFSGSLSDPYTIEMERLPVIAWEASDWGDAFVVNDDLVNEYPVKQLTCHSRHCGAAVGLFHPEHRPEPEDLLDDAVALVADEVELEHSRARRLAGEANGGAGNHVTTA